MTRTVTTGRRAFLFGATGALGLTQAASTQSVAPERILSVSPHAFGAVGDGRTDDTEAVQRAIDAIAATGGVVLFPPGRYRITSTLRVSSLQPVSLLGQMFGQIYDAGGLASAILVGADMEYLIEYAAPNQSQRSAHGAGTIAGLAFVDPTSPDNAAPGRHRLTAALHLRDFAMGLVESCTFHWIRGSAILADFTVMSTIRGCRVRYTGDPAEPSRSAIVVGQSARFPSQSFLVDDTRVEVCYSREYISVDESCSDITIRSCGFEAATVEYPESSNTFVDIACQRYLIESCTFNRTDAVAVTMRGRGKMIGCHFASGGRPAPSLRIAGDRCMVSNSIFEDNSPSHSIDCSGTQNQILGNIFYSSGGVRMSGRGNVFALNQVSNPTMTGGGWWLELGDHCVAEGNRFDGNGWVVKVGGIVTRNSDRISNNTFDRWSGRPCIGRESRASSINANSFTDVTQPYTETASAARPSAGPRRVNFDGNGDDQSLREAIRLAHERIEQLERMAGMHTRRG